MVEKLVDAKVARKGNMRVVMWALVKAYTMAAKKVTLTVERKGFRMVGMLEVMKVDYSADKLVEY